MASVGERSEAGLDEYRRKRDPVRTPEPFGPPGGSPGSKRRFVVQRHAARRLHYDLRLERDGVLASWAVPKGLPLDRGSRRRAIHTEDHPREYLDFAGVISSGEYGAGVMDIYDSGEYELLEESPSGSLTFTLAGDRLRGTWTLAAAHLDGEERNWLLIRRDGPKGSLPRLQPMLATLHREIPAGEWLFEVKWDGYRTIARLHEGDVALTSRRGQDLTERFRLVAQRLGRGIRVFDCVLDGEVCALDGDGRPSFSLLQQKAGTLVYFVFDLLELEREPLTARPLSERRELLQTVVDPTERTIRFSEAFDDGHQLLELARKQRLEGVVAKRPSSRYMPGARSRDWLKIKTRNSDTFVVAGYVYGEGSRERFGSLVIASRRDGRLVYAGNVGAGFSEATIDEALARARPLRRDSSPFDPVPKDPRLKPGKVVWLEPVLLAEIEYAELTRDGILRAPAYKGFRDDVDPEAPASTEDSAEAEIRRGKRVIRLSRLEYLWWPETGFRKVDLIEYYRRISPVLLPHLRNRPFTLKRYLNGPKAPFEWIKDAPAELPDWVRRCPLPAKTRAGELVEYPLVNDELALVWMIDYGCIDLHLWYSRCDKPARPDYVLFDLDPAGVDFDSVAEAALLLHELLSAIGLESFVRTSGGDGLHVQVPVARRYTYADTRRFAEIVADALVRARPTLVTTERDLERRRGVFVDTKMNGEGMTIASVYSARPLPGPPVATPLDWDELGSGLDPSAFTPPVVLERVAERGDLHASLLSSRQRLEPALARVGG